MDLAAAFLLGLVGSLHCVGMCGPLALAVPVIGTGRRNFMVSRLLYNGGRITTYSLLGFGFGLVGASMVVAGLQQWLSIVAGAVLLAGVILSCGQRFSVPVLRAVGGLKKSLATLLQRRSYGSIFVLGVLNGLLPCGLVYAACAGAAATGELFQGSLYMTVFGVGTLPAMIGLAWGGAKLNLGRRWNMGRVVPATIVLLGLLLVVRGLALGIPYLSPDLTSCSACH